jgi:hypothetical protein
MVPLPRVAQPCIFVLVFAPGIALNIVLLNSFGVTMCGPAAVHLVFPGCSSSTLREGPVVGALGGGERWARPARWAGP